MSSSRASSRRFVLQPPPVRDRASEERPSSSPSALSVHVFAKSNPCGQLALRAFLQRVIARALCVTKESFQIQPSIKRCPAGRLHRKIDGGQYRAADQSATDKNAIGRGQTWVVGCCCCNHVRECELRDRELVHHPADQMPHMSIEAPLTRLFHRQIARRLRNADVRAVDQGKGKHRDHVEQRGPLTLRTLAA